ncbi:hypothetical protein BGW39_000548 [Mortierella sp. 14UC]|nr:hypothetical protein BGW39_000548 [Mortierella sp. 14UC]
MTQEIKRPAQFLAFSLTPPLSPMTAPDSNTERSCKSAKLSSVRKPFFSLGYTSSPTSPSPSSCLKNRQNPSSPSSPISKVFPSSTSPSSHGVERPAVGKAAAFNVQFLPSEEYKPEGKAGYLPRTPYPLTREEDERIFQSFLTALNEE